MSSRSTRSKSTRSAKLTLKEELAQEGQTQLGDFFKNTRRGAKTAKDVTEKNAVLEQETRVLQPKTRTRTQKVAVRAVPSPPKMKREESPSIISIQSAAPTELSPPAGLQVSPQKPVSRRLFGGGSNAVSLPDSLPLLEKADQMITVLQENADARKTIKKTVRSVQELQARLAEKGAARLLHKQNIQRKEDAVLQSAELLKSPVKTVPAGPLAFSTFMTSKSRPANHKKLEKNPIKFVSEVPDYIIPVTAKTPVKRDSEREENPDEKNPFDYGKVALLKDDIKESVKVPLPKQYALLHEMFQNKDRVLSIFAQQGKRSTLEDVELNVQRNLKKNFSTKEYCQMVHLYGKADDVKLEQKWQAFGGVQKGKWEHVVKPNIVDDLTAYMRPESPSKEREETPLVTPSKLCSPTKMMGRSPKKALFKPQPREAGPDARLRLEGWRMTCRAYVFRHKLAELVRKAHHKFLEKIGMQLSPEELSKLKRFHPSFDLESECPEIEQQPLPEPPKEEKKASTMSDYMKSLEVVSTLPASVQGALNALRSPLKPSTTASGVPLSPKKFVEQKEKEGKKSGMQSLLERIRAKDAARKQAEMSVDKVKEGKKAMLDRLLRSYLRCICSLYAFKKARSMEVSIVVDKLVYAHAMLGKEDARSHLDMLCSAAPAYFGITEVVGKKYLQLHKNIYEEIEAELKQELASLS